MENTQEILSVLNTLELQRVAELKKFGIIALVVLFVNLLFFIKFRSNFLPSLGLGFIVLVGSYYFINTKYKNQVQTSLIPKMLKEVDSDYKYNSNIKINLNKLNDLKFFSHKLDESQSEARVSLMSNNQTLNFWFLTLESAKIDGDEGRHGTKRFEGLFVELELSNGVNQKYLIGQKTERTPVFEAGDYLNPPHMGLKLVGTLSDDWLLYSENGTSNLRNDFLEKLKLFKEKLKVPMWVIFDKNRVYILSQSVKGNFEISLFSSLKNDSFVKNYVELLGDFKKLL